MARSRDEKETEGTLMSISGEESYSVLGVLDLQLDFEF